MQPHIVYQSPNQNPKLSIILLDWSCRESFHSLFYLNSQTVPRDQYEILWIEYYHRVAPEIHQYLYQSAINGSPPAVDQWIVMGIPENIYYHKHLMNNIGVLAARGEIICICDSDAIFSPTFVQSVLQTFSANQNIVLHLDEIRNESGRFYPFNYPSIEEVLGEGCINWANGRSIGMDHPDPLHHRNYGACMCALRNDIIAIGGGDEHMNYLGHISGAVDMTFRLVNAGKREIWHEQEYLYHVWHPGTGGEGNYFGPHDGRHVSTTTLEARQTGRILPLNENRSIKAVRLGFKNLLQEDLLPYALQADKLGTWVIGIPRT